jgi:hypothetical protein
MVDAGLQQERADLAFTERELERVQSRLTRLQWAADRIKLIREKVPYVEHEILMTQKALADLRARREAILLTIAKLESETPPSD